MFRRSILNNTSGLMHLDGRFVDAELRLPCRRDVTSGSQLQRVQGGPGCPLDFWLPLPAPRIIFFAVHPLRYLSHWLYFSYWTLISLMMSLDKKTIFGVLLSGIHCNWIAQIDHRHRPTIDNVSSPQSQTFWQALKNCKLISLIRADVRTIFVLTMSRCFNQRQQFYFLRSCLNCRVMASAAPHAGTYPSIWQAGLYCLCSKCTKLPQTVRTSTSSAPVAAGREK